MKAINYLKMDEKNKQVKKDSQNNDKGPQKPKFSSYWIYILIAVIFLSLQFFNFGGSVEQLGQVKLETLIKSGEVSKLVVVNNKYAEVYLRKDQNATQSTDTETKGLNSFSQDAPDYTYNFISPDEFSKWIYELEKEA